ncbi:hypothetical protein NSTC745_04621 [Nostoc sp. DSM 114161]
MWGEDKRRDKSPSLQRIEVLLNLGMKLYVLKFKTPYPLCVSAPLREKNHPAFMQRQN